MIASLSTILGLLGLVYANPISVEEWQAECQSVHIFIARGSEEPYPGRQGDLATAICSDITSCGYEDIVYPATFEDYCSSETEGATNGKAAITAYAASCPDAKLVLTGYSQVCFRSLWAGITINIY